MWYNLTMKNKLDNKWIMEVKVSTTSPVEKTEWLAVCPTGGKRFEYNTRLEALRMLNMCYPDCVYGDTVRTRLLFDGE